MTLLADREQSVAIAGVTTTPMSCDKPSTPGAVSQRACVYCGSRVVLYPIADALHLVHGPLGCAAYTWDIRGAQSSGPELHRLSFTTDLRENDIIFGGEQKLERSLDILIKRHHPKAAFVYSTCVVGLIGDDVEAICRKMTERFKLPVISVHSEGFKGTKKDGYAAACNALSTLIGTAEPAATGPYSVNLLGEFNIAGESWVIRRYLEQMGISVVAVMTGDGRVEDIRRAHGAKLNLVQCSGSMTALAKTMQERFEIPYLRVSFFGFEDCAKALYDIAKHFNDPVIWQRTKDLVRTEINRIQPEITSLRRDLEGKRAALYVGGAFKAFSLVRALRQLGMSVVMAGTQTGGVEDYQHLQELCDKDTIIADDTNPLELASFLERQDVDVFIGGVKERPVAYKLGVGFCDHNHERKIGLAGFEGMLAFAKEIHGTVMSPVWKLVPRRGRNSSRSAFGVSAPKGYRRSALDSPAKTSPVLAARCPVTEKSCVSDGDCGACHVPNGGQP